MDNWRSTNQPRRVVRAAKRLAQARRDRGVNVPNWEEMPDHIKQVYLADARAVIRGDDQDDKDYRQQEGTPTNERPGSSTTNEQ